MVKTFRQFLEEGKKLSLERGEETPVVSLLHHPTHGVHHEHGYGSHHIIRKKLRLDKNGDEFEHTAHAYMDKANKNLLIGHHGVPKHTDVVKGHFESKVKKHYKLPKDSGIRHYNINSNKEF
jgi:hypothetical protein